jgi:hypothetical protein
MFITTNSSWRGLFSLLPRPPPGSAGTDSGFSCAPLPAPASSLAVPGWRNLVAAIALRAMVQTHPCEFNARPRHQNQSVKRTLHHATFTTGSL